MLSSASDVRYRYLSELSGETMRMFHPGGVDRADPDLSLRAAAIGLSPAD
jgi:hypothetical protein